MVVVLHPEHVHQRLVAHRLAHIGKQCRLGLGQHGVQGGVGDLAQLRVAALAQYLGRVVHILGIDHPLHPFGGEELVLQHPDAGGDGQKVVFLQLLYLF